MAMLYQRARKVAYNRSSSSSFDSGYGESKHCDTASSPSSSSTVVWKLHRSAGIQNFIDLLERDGAVVVEDFTDMATLEQANEEVQPWLEQPGLGQKSQTGAVTQLLKRSPTVREKFYADHLYQELVEYFLTQETTSWEADEPVIQRSHALFSSAVTFDVPPGTGATRLARDDRYYHVQHFPSHQYEAGRDVLLRLDVPGSDVLKAHGAPRIIPGSHLWGDDKPGMGQAGDQGVVDVELKKGEALITLGSVYHANGDYPKPVFAVNESRTSHVLFSCAGSYRQEENPFLSYSKDDVHSFSPLVQRRLGWRQQEPGLGWVNLQKPDLVLDG